MKMKVIKPHHLRSGDLIGVISPAGPVTDHARLNRGIKYLERQGYRVRVGEHALKAFGYLAGSDAERLDDLHTMFADREVRAIFCSRGGYGMSRLLAGVNYELIARNPKILLGFSDITALQLALWRKCRLVTFHGPMVHADFCDTINPFMESALWPLLTEAVRPPPITCLETEAHIWRGGSAGGRLLGGNLSLVVSLLGTPYWPELRNALLFLEEVAEEPYRIDRLLAHLGNAGVWPKISGLLAGQFGHCQPRKDATANFSVLDVFSQLSSRLTQPFVSDLPFGHVARKCTLPVGIRARWKPEHRQLVMQEAAVS
jgi:muramoyltetrapeptide carboxypeptidase